MEKERPRFAKLQGKIESVALRLNGKARYYRDAGYWEIGSKWDADGKLVSKSTMKHLRGLELIEITHAEWYKDNEGYAPELDKD